MKNKKILIVHNKPEWFFFFIILLITLTISNSKSSLKLNLNSAAIPLRNYFYIQRLYPGNDPLDNIKESEFNSEKKFLEVNDEVIFLARSLDKISEIEDSLNISDIWDEKNDKMGTAECCNRLTYEEFPAGNTLDTIIPAIKSTVKGKTLIERAKAKGKNGGTGICNSKASRAALMPSFRVSPVNTPSISRKMEKKLKNQENIANFCLMIFVPDEVRWRICAEKKNDIMKLQMKIVYSVLKFKSNRNFDILERLISNPKGLTTPSIGKWNWDEQQKWRGRCKSGIMQSPINYQRATVRKAGKSFSMSMHLTNVHTLIKRNFGELIVVLLNFGGVLKIDIENTFLLYTPQYITFRFPGETIIDGVRSMGDIQIHFVELSDKRRTATTNGLILNVPLKPNNRKTSIEELDSLNLEFWRHEVLKKGVYTPKKFMKNQLSIFSLDGLSRKIINNKPNFMINMGSETIPPCVENIIHITLDKPLEIPGCQFKLLREASLVSSRAKEIHARVEQNIKERPIYKFDTRFVSYINSIDGLVPQSFNKYLLKYGYGYMFRLGQKRGRNGWYGKNGKWSKRYSRWKYQKGGFGPGYQKGKSKAKDDDSDDYGEDKLDCDVPN